MQLYDRQLVAAKLSFTSGPKLGSILHGRINTNPETDCKSANPIAETFWMKIYFGYFFPFQYLQIEYLSTQNVVTRLGMARFLLLHKNFGCRENTPQFTVRAFLRSYRIFIKIFIEYLLIEKLSNFFWEKCILPP